MARVPARLVAAYPRVSTTDALGHGVAAYPHNSTLAKEYRRLPVLQRSSIPALSTPVHSTCSRVVACPDLSTDLERSGQ
eukprot:1344375-Rhodomonas_salina.4